MEDSLSKTTKEDVTLCFLDNVKYKSGVSNKDFANNLLDLDSISFGGTYFDGLKKKT